jgi:hypothetical protein
MPISFVGASPVVTGANPTVAVPAGVVAGDTLLLVSSAGSNVPSAPTGWQTIGGSRNRVFIKSAGSSESSVQITIGDANTISIMLAYRGVGYFDVTTSESSSATTTPSTSSLTTRFNNDWILSFYSVINSTPSTTWTAPASTTTRLNQSSSNTIRGLLIVDEAQAVAGASTVRTATLSAAQTWATFAIALKEPQDFYIDPINGNDANNGRTFATALKNISGANAAKAITAGDTVRVEETPTINTGVNATWTSVQQRGISPFNSQNISTATNTTPIAISTPTPHGYSTGDIIQIIGSGNTAANGNWVVTVTSATAFTLNDSSNNGTTGGGFIQPIFCRTIKTATPLVQPIASFANFRTASLGTRVAWVGATANVTTTLQTRFLKGGNDDTIRILAGFTTGKIAYYTLPSTLNLSAYQQLSLFIQQFTGTLGGLTISLCSDTTGDVPVDTFTIPSTSSLSTGMVPFTIDKGSALGSSISSISISRAANNGAQSFNINSIVACKAPSAVDALSNTSLVTKNNGTEGAYAVGGFGGSDGSIVFLENNPGDANLTTTGGAYYGTTETASLWRIEPYNPFTLNSVALPTSQFANNPYCDYIVAGISNNRITFSGGWDTTNMSTRTGQTWFSNQNSFGIGLNPQAWTETLRINYTRAGILINPSGGRRGFIFRDCNYTASPATAFSQSTNPEMQFQNCIFTNNATNNFSMGGGSDNIENPAILNNCTFAGPTQSNISGLNNSNTPYVSITNCNFYTSPTSAITITGNPMFGTIRDCSIAYFNNRAFIITTSFVGGNIENIALTPAPTSNSISLIEVTANTWSALPQNIYTNFRNITVNSPTTAWTQGNTNITNLVFGGSNCKFYNCSFGAAGISYINRFSVNPGGSTYFYNCSGFAGAVTSSTTQWQPFYLNTAAYSQDEENTIGNNKIYFQGGLATSQTAVRNTPSGYAWSMAPTSTTTVTSEYPIKLKIASIAANGGSPVTISAFMRRTNTGLTMQLVCPGGQPYGPSTDTVASMTAAANTWEQVSISFTPTQNAVYDIYAYAFGGTTFTGYVDDLGVTQ